MTPKAIRTIHAAIDRGITLIDTAPVYGFGRSEEIVGRALAKAAGAIASLIATKVGLDWKDGKPFRNASRGAIMQEVDDSLRRLQTDVIDIYQVHWPDPERADRGDGRARWRTLLAPERSAPSASAISVRRQMDAFRTVAPLHTAQPPYNLFERAIERDVLPYCRDQRHPDAGLWRAVPRLALRQDDRGRRNSPATTCAGTIRNSSRRASRNISTRCERSTTSPRSITASASCIWRCAGCSISGRTLGALGRAAARSARTGRRACSAGSSMPPHMAEIDRILAETISDPGRARIHGAARAQGGLTSGPR